MLQRSGDHLASVNETYWQHGRHAVGIALRLWAAAFAVVVHAVVPALFTHTATDTCEAIVRERDARTARANAST
jgi:hypothetical protein